MAAKKKLIGGAMYLLPAAPGACPVCARNPAHDRDQPHDAQSLFYQYQFLAKHGRWPNWRDAMKHCSAQVKQHWITELKKRGAWHERRHIRGNQKSK